MQAALLELLRLAGVQDRELTVGKAPPVTVPPVDESGIKNPLGEAAKLLLIGIAVTVVPTAMIRFTTATAPFEIMPASTPDAIQVYIPMVVEQFRILEELIDAGPAVTEMETMLAGG